MHNDSFHLLEVVFKVLFSCKLKGGHGLEKAFLILTLALWNTMDSTSGSVALGIVFFLNGHF